MKMREIAYPGQPPIDSYAAGGFRIGGTAVLGDVLVGPNGVTTVGAALDAAAITAVLEIAGTVDVVLVGLGAEIAALPGDLRSRLEAAGLGVEAMATPAACRTYNVMLAEERRVAALLVAL
ncbi:MAG: Mth938-like domain-containing protein [Paracoccaceae bacterium]